MRALKGVALIGNHLPRRCGIATFTYDLHRALSTARPDLETGVVAMTDRGSGYEYPPAVRFEIHDQTIGDYARAAEFLNNGDSTSSPSSTNTASSAARRADISSSSCRAWTCRS